MYPKKLKISLLSASVMLALSGCAAVTVDEVKKESEAEFKRINQAYEQGRKIAPKMSSISYMDGFYVSEKPYKMADREVLPSFFNEDVSFSSQDPTSFQRLTALVSERIGVRISYSDDANQYLDNWMSEGDSGGDEATVTPFESDGMAGGGSGEGSGGSEGGVPGSITELMQGDYGNLPGAAVTFTLEHNGTLSELLDSLTGRVGLYWKWQDNEVVIFRTESKNITVDVDAISQSFSATIKSESAFVSGEGEEAAGQGMESAYNIAKTDPLDSLKTVIQNTILSDQGSVEIFPDFSIVSVKDIPPNIKKAQRFLEDISNTATRQVFIKVDVVTVTDRNDAQAGFDWEAIYNGISGLSAGFSADMFEGDGNIQIGIIDTESAFNGTSGFIRALDQYADVSSHYSGFAQTTNGRLVPITDNVKEDYIRKITVEEGEDGESDKVNTEIGEAKTGIDMMVVPLITSKDKIALNIKYDLNELISMKTSSTLGTTISLPTSAVKGSYIKTIIESGKTYMVAGTSSKKTKVDTASVAGDDSAFAWILGGKKEAVRQEEYSILLITPYILGD